MASSSEMVTDAGFWASACAGGDGAWAGGDCATGGTRNSYCDRQRIENANAVNAWAVSLLKEGGTQIGVPGTAHKEGDCLCGGCAGGKASGGRTGGEVIPLRFGPRPAGNRNTYANARRRRFDGLMAQMADRAGVGRSVGVMMPDSPERRPDHQREQRYGQQQRARFVLCQTRLRRIAKTLMESD